MIEIRSVFLDMALHALQNLGSKEINTTVQSSGPTFAGSATECGSKVINNSSRNFSLILKACEVNQCCHDDRIEFNKKTLLTRFCFDSQVFGSLGWLERDHRPL